MKLDIINFALFHPDTRLAWSSIFWESNFNLILLELAEASSSSVGKYWHSHSSGTLRSSMIFEYMSTFDLRYNSRFLNHSIMLEESIDFDNFSLSSNS